ncbi:putative T7SS-secreted protein [Kitasatospora sp. NPDC101157]|uniref:WXG100 family type VII secretion target n=1 Tax=Kitasatospora sp. NPDC101157 TaxID=3364098 RepID=UPI003825B692
MTDPRPAPDWSGLGFNPTPGDPAAVAGLSSSLRRVSQHLTGVHTTLAQISGDQGQWTGDAAKAFAARFGKLPGYLQDAADSITAAYRALDFWYQALTEHQPKAAELARAAVTAQQDRAQAEQAHRTAAAAPDLALAGRSFPDEASLAAAEQRYNAARNRLDAAAELVNSATATLTGLRSQARELAEGHESDAHRTATAIRRAADSKAPPEPGRLSRVGNWLKAHGADLLTVAAGVCGVAAIFFPAFALPAILLSAAAAGAHARQYGISGLLPTSMANLGNDLTLAGDLLGAIPGGAVLKGGFTAFRTARATGTGVRASVGVGATEVRTAARAIDPAGPVFTTAIEKPAVKLGLSKATAMNISDGVQTAGSAALTAPTAYGLTQDDAGPGLIAAVNYTTGGGNVINGAGGAIGGTGTTRILPGLLGAGSAVATGVWGAGH